MDPCVHLHPFPEPLNSPQTQTTAMIPNVPVCLADRRTPWENLEANIPLEVVILCQLPEGGGTPRDLGSPCRHCPELGWSCPSCSQVWVPTYFSSLNFRITQKIVRFPLVASPCPSTAGSHHGPVMRGTSLLRHPSYPHIPALEMWILPLWHQKGLS